MFFNTASKHHKLQGVVWGCVGGGSAAGGAAPITFGHHRRPPARTRPAWPAPRFKGLRLTAARRPSNLGTGLALWPYVGLCWPMLSYLGSHVGAIYVETLLRCQFFRPGPHFGDQNHVKTDVF